MSAEIAQAALCDHSCRAAKADAGIFQARVTHAREHVKCADSLQGLRRRLWRKVIFVKPTCHDKGLARSTQHPSTHTGKVAEVFVEVVRRLRRVAKNRLHRDARMAETPKRARADARGDCVVCQCMCM